MPEKPEIRILCTNPNERGDLFGRLMKGLFLALGYDDIRLNIHKTGREIDIQARHRTENRRVIAECKATEDPIGGSDISKFVGVLDAEKRKNPGVPTEGYFISLAGFTETAIEQEDEFDPRRVNLLKGERVVEQLVKGHMLVSEFRASELAGRCCAGSGTDLIPEERGELIAHDVGWIWAIHFTRHLQRTHFALVHADGQLIGLEVGRKIIAADKAIGGNLHELNYLAPTNGEQAAEEDIKTALEDYLSYLSRECGEIQLEGLPADREVGSQRLKLENIFVPLFLQETPQGTTASPGAHIAAAEPAAGPPSKKRGRDANAEGTSGERMSVGSVLTAHSRIAILGLPGSGKSTLLKRLAVAYAFPDRRLLIKDHLPKRVWLPLMIRCRHLNGLAKRPIADILDEISVRAELAEDLQNPFSLLVKRALRSGHVLLLIDGLDEISDEGARLSLVLQLRTFLSTYPNVALVLTSREAGFRVIGGALSSQCAHFRLAEFDDRDIGKLTLAWYKLVVGDTARIRKGAEALAATICAVNRVRQLAQNPLLLTTLLLVQRWVGQLPTKRSVLYAKAIEVLLMTWNVEAHQPLDQEEALPQLEYLAFTMMKEGVQRISLRRLGNVLTASRQEMPEALGFARMSVADFIQRVELRSSLLMVSGHEIENGALSPMYEFRHLTFQEYLTARAIVYGHFPERNDELNWVAVLLPHLSDPNWKEVVPLAAVLAGRTCGALISKLLESSNASPVDESEPEEESAEEESVSPVQLLAICLSDEVQLPPNLLKEAIRCVVEKCADYASLSRVAESKYGPVSVEAGWEAFREGKNLLGIGGLISIRGHEAVGFRSSVPIKKDTIIKIDSLLNGTSMEDVAAGCLIVMHVAFTRSPKSGPQEKNLSKAKFYRTRKADRTILLDWLKRVLPLLKSKDRPLQFVASWALVWLADATDWSPKGNPEVLIDFVSAWIDADAEDWSYMPAWALASLPLIDRQAFKLGEQAPAGVVQFVEAATGRGWYEKAAAYVLAYYLRAPWRDEELAERVLAEIEEYGTSYFDKVLHALGYGEKIKAAELKYFATIH